MNKTCRLYSLAFSELWLHHQETKQLSEELRKFEAKDMENESEEESTDDEFQQEKGDNSPSVSEENSSSQEDEKESGIMGGKNPFAALAGDN